MTEKFDRDVKVRSQRSERSEMRRGRHLVKHCKALQAAEDDGSSCAGRRTDKDSKGWNHQDRINKESPDIVGGVNVGKDDINVGTGDLGLMFGYAVDETHSMATRLVKVLTDLRMNGYLWWLRPDGKTQVKIEYAQQGDEKVPTIADRDQG